MDGIKVTGCDNDDRVSWIGPYLLCAGRRVRSHRPVPNRNDSNRNVPNRNDYNFINLKMGNRESANDYT